MYDFDLILKHALFDTFKFVSLWLCICVFVCQSGVCVCGCVIVSLSNVCGCVSACLCAWLVFVAMCI